MPMRLSPLILPPGGSQAKLKPRRFDESAARMRDMRRHLMQLLAPLLVVLAAASFVPAGVKDRPWWTVQTSGIDTNLRGVSIAEFMDSHQAPAPVVWASGSNGVILRSTDVGKTWQRLRVQGGETLDFRSIHAFDDQKAYVLSSGDGDKSRIYKTMNGGATWKLQYTDKRKGFFLDALVCTSQIECRAVGDPIDGKFVILRTRDGETWEQLPNDQMPAALPDEGAFAASGTCLAIYNDQDIYFVTGGPAARVFHSSDGGYTWTVNSTPIASGNASSGIFSIAVWDKALVIVGGDYKDPERPYRVAAYSQDAGKTWTLAAQQPGGFRSVVAWIDGVTLAAAGPNGEDISEDGGIHWKHTDSLNLNALAILDVSDGWAVGPKGSIALMENRKEYQIRDEREPGSDAAARQGH
jgi:photosystem II stability/assembly factor-like uncharacterized protein